MIRRVLFLFSAALTAPSVLAMPLLQLDVSNGQYSEATESTLATSDTFTLYALLNSTNAAGTYYLSAAIVPAPATAANLGAFTFDGQTVNATADMKWGTPTLLPGHGVYPTWYKEFIFKFDASSKTKNYNVENVSGAHTGPTSVANGNALYKAFDVDVSGLVTGTTLVFDLYSYDAPSSSRGRKALATTGFTFAPFSHNAESTTTTVTNVPESGTTAVFMFLAVVALVLVRGRKAKID